MLFRYQNTYMYIYYRLYICYSLGQNYVFIPGSGKKWGKAFHILTESDLSWIAGSLEPAEKLHGFIYLEGRHQEIDAENVVEPIWKCFGLLIIFPLQNL